MALRQISLATGGKLHRSVPANHVVLVRLTLDQFIFWPKLPPNAGFGIKNVKKFSGGNTPSAGGGDPSRTHLQHSYMPCAGVQAPLLLGPRSRKPFPQIKVYHYTPGGKPTAHRCCLLATNQRDRQTDEHPSVTDTSRILRGQHQ